MNDKQNIMVFDYMKEKDASSTPAWRVTDDPIFRRSRTLAFGLRAAVKAKLDELVRDGILQPVRSSLWATLIVAVIKASY